MKPPQWVAWNRLFSEWLSANLFIREHVTWLHRWWPDACPYLALKDANVFPVVGSIILQLGDFGSQFLDLPILVIHVRLDSLSEGCPVSGLLGSLFNFRVGGVSATFFACLIDGCAEAEYS